MLSIIKQINFVLAALLLLAGCASIDCAAPHRGDRVYENIRDVPSPADGELYWVEGTYFTEYHSEGLIPYISTGARDPRVFRIEKHDAYCVRVAPACGSRLEPTANARRLATGEAIARVSALVRFVGTDTRSVDPGRNQCLPGTVRIEGIKFVRWE